MGDKRSLELFSQKAFKDKQFIGRLVMTEQMKLGRQLTGQEAVQFLGSRLVCPKCESPAMRSTGWTPQTPIGECSICGFHGTMKPIRDYIADGDYK